MFSPLRPCGPSRTLRVRSARSRTARLRTPRSHVLAVLPMLALSGALLLPRAAQAQTVVSPGSGSMAGTVGVVPAGPTRLGAMTVVAAAIDTSGDAEVAKRVLGYANEALKATPGYSPLPTSEYAPLNEKLAKEATKTDWGWPFTASDYQKIGKLSKAPHAMTISVSPLTTGGYEATAEMYDTARGTLMGYGKESATGDDALQTAIGRAVTKLGQTATFNGVILSKPSGYLARISLGTLSGARGGARVEYLDGAGNPVAFGTLFDIAPGESLATVAPETAYPDLAINGRVRIVNNPTEKRALPTFTQLNDKDFNDFQKEFGVALAVSAAIYYLAGGD